MLVFVCQIISQGQGMIALIHLLKNVDAIALGAYDAVILDACCQNIPSADEIWHLVVEMSVLVVAIAHKNNCRSSWYASCHHIHAYLCM